MSRPPLLDPARLMLRLQAGGPQTSQALADTLSVDRVTVQRGLKKLGPAVVQLGKTRGTRHAARRLVLGRPGADVFSRLSPSTGVAHDWGLLSALHGGWHIEWASAAMRPDWADQLHDHAGFCEGLPFFLSDLRPQGFLGRATTRRLPEHLGLPTDPRHWSDDHTLAYLRDHGDDLPGNLSLGETATRRAINARPAEPVTPATRGTRYPALAAAANAGEPVGSSVEGEQPKFTAWLRPNDDGPVLAAIVKFTDRLETPTGRRWADLLAAEAVALDVLTWASRGDAEANPPQTFDFEGRRFYELPRFDRVGAHGRRGVVSLRALHDAGFTGGDTHDWAVAAAGLHARGWINAADLRAVRLRRLFGRLIGNTDMHFGNLAFFLEPELPLRLAPTYDMLPMLWAPHPGDATPAPVFHPPAPMPAELDLWPEAASMAGRFWTQLEADPRISDDFRHHASAALRAVCALRERFG